MTKSGSTNSSQLSSIDFGLIIIAVFCTSILIFVGLLCCPRKRSRGKKKPFQRKIRKGKKCEEHIPLKVFESSTDDQGPSSQTNSPSRKNRKISPSDQGAPSILHWIRPHSHQEDVEQGKEQLKETRQKKGNKKSKRQDKSREHTSTEKLHRMDKQRESVPTQMIDLSANSSPNNEDEPMEMWNNTNMSDSKQTSKRGKRPCTEDDPCTGIKCRKCIPYRDDKESEHVVQAKPVQSGEKSRREVGTNPVTLGKYGGLDQEVVSDDNQHVKPGSPSEDWVMVPSPEDHTDEVTPASHEVKPGKILAKKTSSSMEVIEADFVDHVPSTDVDKEVTETDYGCPVRTEAVNPPPVLKSINKAWTADQPAMVFVKPQEEAKLSPTKQDDLFESKQNRESVGNVLNVEEYASREWKGDTVKAEIIRKGYFHVFDKLGLHNLRQVRGDNYCGIRSTLFQALVQNIPILSQFPTNILKIPEQLMSAGCTWIEEWTFGRRIQVENGSVCNTMGKCLQELHNLVALNNKMPNKEGRESHLLSSLNYNPQEFEIRLMEAVKLLMLASAIKLYKLQQSGRDIPLFAVIMFARDSSANPRQFMKSHLNAVGDTGGMEQVEMCLLGYTLGITIRVVRPSQFGQPDFIASYPEDMPSDTPSVTLVAEDDRHYNILT